MMAAHCSAAFWEHAAHFHLCLEHSAASTIEKSPIAVKKLDAQKIGTTYLLSILVVSIVHKAKSTRMAPFVFHHPHT